MTTRHVFIDWGQSPMTGYGNLPSPLPTYANNARIWVYTQHWDANNNLPINITNPADGTWVQSKDDPIHAEPGSGVSPMKALADRWLTLMLPTIPDLEVGIVPCSKGGTSLLLDWRRIYHQGTLFPTMIARGHAAMSWGTIKAVFGDQSVYEATQANPPNDLLYPRWLEAYYDFVNSVRVEFENLALPFIHFGLGANNSGVSYPNWTPMQQYQYGMANGTPRKLRVIDCTDIPTMPDGIHPTATGNVTKGTRGADALYAML